MVETLSLPRSLGRLGRLFTGSLFAFRRNRHARSAGKRLNVLYFSKTECGPVRIYRDLTNWFEASVSKNRPATVAIEFTTILLGGSLGVSNPQYGVPFNGFDQLLGTVVEILLGDCESKSETCILLPVCFPNDLHIFQLLQLGIEGVRRIQNKDWVLVGEVEFFEKR